MHTHGNSHTYPRLESMCCLYRALIHWFNPIVHLHVHKLERMHMLLLGSTQPSIARKVWIMDNKVVYVEPKEELGIHVFMWPMDVIPTLQHLLQRAEEKLAHLREEKTNVGVHVI